ncbi:hypothetical protein NDU88_004495 [Pleurodeles waltl]|uniref:Uncharacterized protein n=1 Tax=Pleurodeles waltl TaxID=8319 RepID=A0AAV7T8A7_PLEWA|nr:hypothetical protein NDU88_004495 [Pleurodeles waltl]
MSYWRSQRKEKTPPQGPPPSGTSITITGRGRPPEPQVNLGNGARGVGEPKSIAQERGEEQSTPCPTLCSSMDFSLLAAFVAAASLSWPGPSTASYHRLWASRAPLPSIILLDPLWLQTHICPSLLALGIRCTCTLLSCLRSADPSPTGPPPSSRLELTHAAWKGLGDGHKPCRILGTWSELY